MSLLAGIVRMFVAGAVLVAASASVARGGSAQDAETPPFDPAGFAAGVELVVEGFEEPVYVAAAGDESGRLFVVEQPGRIKIVRDGQVDEEPFLDIVDMVGSEGSEQGLLSVAFHPDYAANGLFYVDYTDLEGDTVVARYHVSADDPDRADPASAETLMTVDQPYRNHNGGLLLFGPDGYLYVGLGDGGSGGDPEGHAQDTTTLLGSILRIDVNATSGDLPYAIPADNPFAGDGDAAPELWNYGLRNPWRFSFDRATGDLYIADVGQNAYEEVNFQPADSTGGENYGWNLMEGAHCYPEEASCDETGLVLPVAEYGRDGGCSVTGGYVYRGSAFPALTGVYLFADYCSGLLWGLGRDAAGDWVLSEPLETGLTVSSFGEDAAGELYVTDHSGGLYRLTAG